jgi:Transport and Golgi organisation 2
VCTVSAIPGTWLHPGFGVGASSSSLALPLLRVVCNRDERRTRTRALAPTIFQIGDRSVLMPIDPEGKGTWIAANDAGLVFTLLNVTDVALLGHGRRGPALSARSAGARKSRGEILQATARATTLNGAQNAVQSLPADDYLPFRVVVWSEHDMLEMVSDGRGYRVGHGPLHSAVLRTSSSLGDACVTGLRQALFERLLCQILTPAAQDAFHRHSWSDRREVSVLMSRPDARTVSVTTIELYQDRVEMAYHDVDAPLSNCRTLRIAAPSAPDEPVAPAAPVASAASVAW